MRTLRRQARFAGLLYFLMLLSAPVSLLLVPARVIVKGNAAATAEQLRSSETLWRLGIGADLFHQVVLVFLALALYRLFAPVQVSLARHLVVLGALIPVPIMFVSVLHAVAALALAQGASFLAAIDPAQRDAFAYLFVFLQGHGVALASVFWGLWLFPFGRLVIRSGFIPPAFGYLLYAAGAAYLAGASARLLAPDVAPAVNAIAEPLQIAEAPIILWLLIAGARGPAAGSPAAA